MHNRLLLGAGALAVCAALAGEAMAQANQADTSTRLQPNGFDASRLSNNDVGTFSAVSVLADDQLDATLSGQLAKSDIKVYGGMEGACVGFRTLGQCVAALHIVRNLNIDGGFAAFKAEATAKGSNINKAIQKLQPAANPSDEEKKANGQARADIGAASSVLKKAKSKG